MQCQVLINKHDNYWLCFVKDACSRTSIGSFTMANSNSFLSPCEIDLIAKESKFKEIFLFNNEIVCCMYSLESPHRDDSIEYIQHTNIF